MSGEDVRILSVWPESNDSLKVAIKMLAIDANSRRAEIGKSGGGYKFMGLISRDGFY